MNHEHPVADRPVGLVLDPCFEEHDTGPSHVESPERLRYLRADLARRGALAGLQAVAVEAADDTQLGRVHTADYLRHVQQVCAAGAGFLDSEDTVVSRASERVARLAAGSVSALCREVARGGLARGFAAVRPPGHHAERDRAMGFCLYNNVAVAARELTDREGLSRVLIVDWDVHHGNGTQHIFEESPDVFFFSVHQWPLYPGTGARDERGHGAGRFMTLNCPLAPGAGDAEFLGSLRDELQPAADRFQPEFVIVSAGFDAHRSDPLGGLAVSTEAFGEATRIVRGIAERWAGGRMVSVLEGGYDLSALADSVTAHLEVMK